MGSDDRTSRHGPFASQGRTILERRERLLPPSYRLFYEDPVHLVRGEGVRVWDRDGNEYLDAYNNVVSLGHSHPRVIEAVHAQMAALTTNTRYLHDGILDYTEDLLSTFKGRLANDGRAMYTCTGTEANDLALRIAKQHTRQNGVIVTERAYHGNSEQVAAISPSMSARSRWTRTVPRPDSYRRPSDDMGTWLAERVSEQIEDLRREGVGFAAFVVNSLFSSDGIYAHPTDVLQMVAEVVHEAGGLFIADEVQSGFGRSGETMWGFERHNVEPDIVTMGKPMGNGYPVGGLIMHESVVDPSMRYFNTSGGNTVAMAAAHATLEVLRDEGLMENCMQVGGHLMDGLQDLAKRHVLIGDVRGIGLFLGVELVRDRGTMEPDPRTTSQVVNEMRRRKILISATGPNSTVLKIRPPLCLALSDVARLLDELDAVLTDLGPR